MSDIIIGAAVGVVIGSGAAILKFVFLWQRYLKKGKQDGAAPNEATQVYMRSILSFIINVGILAIVFLARNILPFSWVACIVAVAVAFSITNGVLTARQNRRSKDGAEQHD